MGFAEAENNHDQDKVAELNILREHHKTASGFSSSGMLVRQAHMFYHSGYTGCRFLCMI